MKITDYEPKRVFHHFEAISQIPRGSGNEKAVSDFIAAFAKELGLEHVQDDFYNLVIYKPGTSGYENSPPVILQGHLDMVCEKNAGTKHDFLKDPIKFKIDGDFLKADGTTLGADNGIAVAYCMALLEATDIAHPPLEIVLTSDEEAGMTGATNLEGSLLKGRRMINMDSGSVGVGCFTAGSAAASTAEYTLPVKWKERDCVSLVYYITVNGLIGGHSGGDIKKERGNAIRILGIVLNHISKTVDFSIADIKGGIKVNAIPREATAVIEVSPEYGEKLTSAFGECVENLKRFYRVADPGLEINLTHNKDTSKTIMYSFDCENLINSLLLLPCGVQMMSRDIEGLVAASCNIGIVETLREAVKITCMARGASREHTSFVDDKIIALASLTQAKLELVDRSPAWEFNPDSEIIRLFASYYKELTGNEPKVTAMHGGLECGIFAEKLPGLDIVALGPEMHDLHTPQERVSISSTEEMWKLLCGALGKMK